jgi:hypothetical protein
MWLRAVIDELSTGLRLTLCPEPVEGRFDKLTADDRISLRQVER